MIVVKLTGGLGNQMFQYAMGRALAERTQSKLKLDLSNYGGQGETRPQGLEQFVRPVGIFKWNVSAEVATEAEIDALRDDYWRATTRDRIVRRLRRFYPGLLWPRTHFRESSHRFDAKVATLAAPMYLDGYWQSEKYFAAIRSTLLVEFTPKDETVLAFARGYVEKLRAEQEGPLVSLHVRRGDLAHAAETLGKVGLVYGPPVGLDYVHAAIAEFPPPSRFLVFSDSAKDVQWCRENIRSDRLSFSEGHTDLEDLMLMSQCDHHIIANSTFSWWAAWLDQKPFKRVIAPRQWSSPGGAYDFPTDDLIPAGWVKL